mgnify:CR=1 FL=1
MTYSSLVLFLPCYPIPLCNIFRSNAHREKTVPGLWKRVDLSYKYLQLRMLLHKSEDLFQKVKSKVELSLLVD